MCWLLFLYCAFKIVSQNTIAHEFSYRLALYTRVAVDGVRFLKKVGEITGKEEAVYKVQTALRSLVLGDDKVSEDLN